MGKSMLHAERARQHERGISGELVEGHRERGRRTATEE